MGMGRNFKSLHGEKPGKSSPCGSQAPGRLPFWLWVPVPFAFECLTVPEGCGEPTPPSPPCPTLTGRKQETVGN